MEGTNPVNKKLAAALSGGAVLVLALTGCSSSDDNEKLDSWAKDVCEGVQPRPRRSRRPTRRSRTGMASEQGFLEPA
ncbi:hypothetical protein STENM327S_04854 [Streptomyces tendae]